MAAAAAEPKLPSADVEGGTSLISTFVRVKPLEVEDRMGGAAGQKQIAGWKESSIAVSIGGGGSSSSASASSSSAKRDNNGRADGDKVFDHMKAVIAPEASQEEVYDRVARPLVEAWLGGVDCDLISYGQTGSGKTFTMFGPPFSMEKAAADLGGGSGEGVEVLKPEHGLILRSGLEALAAVDAMNRPGGGGLKAVLHGSMVEMSIISFTDQTVTDLLNNRQQTHIDKSHHLCGARLQRLESVADVVAMAAAVETRLVRGTRMNDTSSRSHCAAVYTLTVLEGGEGGGGGALVRTSRLQFFDLMGSERFKGGNSAHDENKSAKSSAGGFEGIFANLSLAALASAVDAAATNRRAQKKKKKNSSGGGSDGGKKSSGAAAQKKAHNPMVEFVLTEMLAGSLRGDSLTAMVTCVSQSPRNGDESYLTLTYGAGMARLLNAPRRQPARRLDALLREARKQHEASAAIVAKGVQGKYQARRTAEAFQWAQTVALLEEFS